MLITGTLAVDTSGTPLREDPPVSPMRLLESGIPLSLLYDLVLGPESADLLDQEQHSAADGSLVPVAQAGRHRSHRALRTV